MATNLFNTYSAEEISIVLGGIAITGGRGTDTFLSIAYNEEMYTLAVGVGNDSTRSKTNNRSAQLTITLMYNSPVNTELSALFNLDANSPGGAGVVPFFCRDNNGDTLLSAKNCWIMKMPDFELGRESGEVEWVLEAANLLTVVGGANT